MKISLKTMVARLIVFVLFGMLILSFAVWGIGDIFRRGIGTQSVAEVGSVRILPMEFQEQYRRELRRVQGMSQTEITAERARELGLPQRVLRDMVARVLLDLAARDAGVAVSDEVVRQAIFDNPAFHNSEGKFDRSVFESLLLNAGYTEDRFVALTRQDIVRSQVIGAVTAGDAVPHPLLDDLYRYREERRTADAIMIGAASIKDVPTPSDAEIAAYHKDHAKAFTAPEYRAVTVVELRPEDLAARLTVDGDKLKDEYEARLSEFKVPEERVLHQIILKDEATAKDASERLTKGEDFEKVAEELTGKPPLDLGTVKQTDVPVPELAAAAFALPEGGLTEPVQTPLGWHIAQVVKIVAGRTQSFEEAKDRLSHELALREAGEAVFDLGNKLQDALGGGSTLEEAAQKLELKQVKFEAVDNTGLAPDGERPPALPETAKFLVTAFATEPGRDSELTEDGQGGYFILRVEKVTPSELRPLAAVRDK
ncbi:MAG: SurA N-terminal domain-containing protein, partial [Alphaproteobacteria bacterium]